MLFFLDEEHDRLTHGVSREINIALVGLFLALFLVPIAPFLALLALPTLFYGVGTFLVDNRKLKVVSSALDNIKREYVAGPL